MAKCFTIRPFVFWSHVRDWFLALTVLALVSYIGLQFWLTWLEWWAQ
jgi:hypothetical protein